MLESIVLKTGNTDHPSHITIDTGEAPLTIFVGPNNSGKSLALREIHHFMTCGISKGRLLHDVVFVTPSDEEILERIQELAESESPERGTIVVRTGESVHTINKSSLIDAMQHPNEKSEQFCSLYANREAILLNGRGRFSILNTMPIGNLLTPPTHRLRVLYDDLAKRRQLREFTHSAFGLYFVLDPTDSGNLKVRFSKSAPDVVDFEHMLDREAIKFQEDAYPQGEMSDGAIAFTSILAEIIAGNPRVIAIDEPEAFLHPSLASQLGKIISNRAREYGKQVFASTHSSHFLMGCLQSGAKANIVRLTYRTQEAAARVIDFATLSKTLGDPMMRSTGILEGLFYDFVVVTEGDSDRAFYQEVNKRLLDSDPPRGMQNSLFLNAQNKQTVHRIVAFLRNAGIPAATILDIDAVKLTRMEWSNLVNALNMPLDIANSLGLARSNICRHFDSVGDREVKSRGIEALSDRDVIESAKWLFSGMAEYGAFVVPVGELESWLPELGSRRNKSTWLSDTLNHMGSEPTSDKYVRPSADDVWAFMDRVSAWCMDKNRCGVP